MKAREKALEDQVLEFATTIRELQHELAQEIRRGEKVSAMLGECIRELEDYAIDWRNNHTPMDDHNDWTDEESAKEEYDRIMELVAAARYACARQ